MKVRNIIKITIRRIKKEFGYCMLVFLSLTAGIVSSLLLLLYVFDDLSYDQFHTYKDRIVRVVSQVKQPDEELVVGTTQMPFGPQAKEDYPEIEEFVRIRPLNREVFIFKETSLYDDYVYYADSSFFRVFSYDLIAGDPATVLTRPNSMVVTESFMSKYFGAEGSLGRTIETASGQSFEIAGIMKDVPHNSHFTFSALISKNTLSPAMESWDRFGCSTYLLLKEGTEPNVLQEKMKEMFDKYMSEVFLKRNRKIEYKLEPITDIYLKSEATGYFSVLSGNIRYVYIFSVVALFMLLIASINYMNLATSRSIRRAKEVGLRKIAGSHRWQLILHFLGESLVFTFIALIFSLVLVIILLPSFNQITEKLFDIHYLLNGYLILGLIGIVLFIGLLGGSYPAIYLARFKPVSVIKQDTNAGKSNFLVRKILVIIQFTISIALAINTLLIHRQVSYMQNKELGFEPHNVVIVPLLNWEMMQQYTLFKNLLLGNPKITGVSSSQNVIGYPPNPSLMLIETSEGMQQRTVNYYAVDYGFVKTMGIEIIHGRDFSEEYRSDSISSVIVNESMVRQFNWDEPLGKSLAFVRGDFAPFSVVGIMKDCHHLGLYKQIEPLMLMLWENNPIVNIKISDRNNVKESIKFIESKWSELFPEYPFEYTFLEDDYDQQFKEDEKRGIIFTWFTLLLLLVTCTGIIGLVAFTVEQRTKELAIRKTMGASIEKIVGMISREFLILVAISMIPASLGAYLYIKSWLQDYAYPVEIDPWIFIVAGLLAIVLTFISVSYSAVRAGLINPADALRLE